MSHKSVPTISRVTIFCTFVTGLATIVGFSFYSLKTGEAGIYTYLVPVLILVAFIGMKIAAPRLPWKQAALAGGVVLTTHFVTEHLTIIFPPFLFLGEVVIQVICVMGFGRYWVANGYIPASSNSWPE